MPTANTKNWVARKMKFTSPEAEQKFFEFGIGKTVCDWLDEYHCEANSTKVRGISFDKQVVSLLRIIYPDLLPANIMKEKKKEFLLIQRQLFNYFSRSISMKQPINSETNGTQQG